MNRDENSLGKWIAVLHKYRRSYVNKKLEPFDISGGQFVILLALSRHDGISQEEISDNLRIDKTMTAKSIKKLESNGYLARKRDISDGRAYNVFLTQRALDIIPLIRQIIKDWEKGITLGMTEEEHQTVERLLNKMADNACSILENE